MALIALLTAGISGAKALTGALSSPERDFRDNPCPDAPSAAEITRAFQAAPQDRKDRLLRAWQLVHGTKPFPYTNPYDFLGAIMGGSDCKVTSKYGPALKSEGIAFAREFGGYAGPAVGDITAHMPEQRDESLGAQITRVTDSLKDAAENVIRSTVTGAVSGARASSQGAAAGAQAGTFAATNSMPLMLFGALGVVLFLLLRKR